MVKTLQQSLCRNRFAGIALRVTETFENSDKKKYIHVHDVLHRGKVVPLIKQSITSLSFLLPEFGNEIRNVPLTLASRNTPSTPKNTREAGFPVFSIHKHVPCCFSERSTPFLSFQSPDDWR